MTLTDGDNVKVLEDSWHKHTLVSPTGYKIFRLGLSGGCSVTPLNQVNMEGLSSHLGIWNCSDWLRLKLNTKMGFKHHHHPSGTFQRVLGIVKAESKKCGEPRNLVPEESFYA